MLVHLRLTTPADLSAAVCEVLAAQECVTNLTFQAGAVLRPEGDLLECDVAREETEDVLRRLEELGVDERGGIVVTSPASTPFREARRLEEAAPGHPDDAVIWESVEAHAHAGAVPTLSYLLFLLLAVILAAIAVVNDSAILVVGAMVVGPEFAVIAAASAGIALRRWGLLLRSVRLFVLSFAFAVGAAALLALLASVMGVLDAGDVTRPRPNTDFIWHPDRWSFIVALVAGAAGALALAIEKTSTMVGVFISVTTVPAAGNLALGLAVREPGEILGSLAQLGTNVAGLLIAGTGVLMFQRAFWPRLMSWWERVLG